MRKFIFTVYFHGIQNHITTGCNIAKAGGAEEFHPSQLPLVALWDTGAARSVISHKIARRFTPIDGEPLRVSTIDGISTHREYKVDILLPDGIAIPSLVVYEGDTGKYDVLIGMDIISLGSFALSNDGINSVFSFQIPSDKVIDFMPNRRVPWWKRMLRHD